MLLKGVPNGKVHSRYVRVVQKVQLRVGCDVKFRFKKG